MYRLEAEAMGKRAGGCRRLLLTDWYSGLPVRFLAALRLFFSAPQRPIIDGLTRKSYYLILQALRKIFPYEKETCL